MRRLLALAALLCVAATAAQAAALRYPQELSPVADGEAADVRVRMTVDDGGAVQKVEVLASSQPDRDADVVAALAAWLFPPDRQRERPSGWTRERRYRFDTPTAAAAVLPVRRTEEADVRWLPEPGSAMQDAGYTPLPNERWLAYPEGEQWSGHDPEVRLEVVVEAAGGLAGARVAEAAAPALGAEALKAMLRECACFV